MVKIEMVPPPSKKPKRFQELETEPGLLARAGAAFGLCERAPTAAEKRARVEELVKYTGQSDVDAARFLGRHGYDVPKAVKEWAGMQGAINLDDADDAETNDNGGVSLENVPPRARGKGSTALVAVAASAPPPLDISITMNRSSYGRILKVMKRISTLSAAATLPRPCIVVIGSESAGKSSMIERIAGASLFPRDAKICTRMPIMLRFVNDDSAPQARITLKFPGRPDQTVREADAADAVGRLMREVVPPGAGVIDTQLTIEVRKASVPTLDLIDLPGIVAASIEGEPTDMMDRTRRISERYLRDAHTIVVVVVPANITRVRDSQAMQLVQKCGKEAATLGVLAKADLAHDPRYKQRKQSSPYWELEQRLAGGADDMVALPNGWVAVKNRDTLVEEESTAASLKHSLQAESDWFASEAHIPDALRATQCGLGAVLAKIDGLFTAHIRSAWVPTALAHLDGQMARVDASIDALGPAPYTLTLDVVLGALVQRLHPDSRIIKQIDALLMAAARTTVGNAVNKVSVGFYASGECNGPSLANVLSKGRLKQAANAEVDKMVDASVDALHKAVQLAFQAGGAPLRIERFCVLRDAVCNSVLMLVRERADDYAAAARAGIARALESGSAPLVQLGLHQANNLLVDVFCECALTKLIAPIVCDFEAICAQLRKDVAAARPAKRARADEPDSSAAQSKSCPKERALLEESCADERAKLAQTKHDLFFAIDDIKKM